MTVTSRSFTLEWRIFSVESNPYYQFKCPIYLYINSEIPFFRNRFYTPIRYKHTEPEQKNRPLLHLFYG